MSLGPVMLDVDGHTLTAEDKAILEHPLVGGVILFSRNFSSVEQLEALVKAIHAIRSPQLLVAVDHEGGRVQRFRDGFSSIPAAGRIGLLYEHDQNRARHLAKMTGWLMAVELRAIDIDFSFAPVLDIDYGVSEVIGNRAFHHDANILSELATAYMQGMHEAGMAATGKHFPGHGAVKEDSHTDIPIDTRDYKDLVARDIVPFKRLIAQGLAGIMPAHVIYKKVDERPAGFSSFWLQDILRNKLNFQGVIFSDDLDMAGAGVMGESYTDRAAAALEAGCDMVLICNNRPAAISVLDELEITENPVQFTRLARMHGRHRVSRNELHQEARWVEAQELLRPYQDDPSMDLNFG